MKMFNIVPHKSIQLKSGNGISYLSLLFANIFKVIKWRRMRSDGR